MTFFSPRLGQTPLGLNAAAVAVQRHTLGRPVDPYSGFNFLVEVDGLLTGGFNTVTGLEAQLEYKKLREGGSLVEFPVLEQLKFPPLVLSHGMTDNNALWRWFRTEQQILIPRRKTVAVMMLDAEQLPVAWWYFKKAYPTKWVGPSFDASSEAVAVERIEFEHQGFRPGTYAPLLMAMRAARPLSR